MELLTKASFSDEVTRREQDNLALSYEAACESMVLLKNDGALPFVSRKVALYGAGASMTIKGGTGSGEVNERHSVTILEGLENRGFTVTTKHWIGEFEDYYREAEKAYKAEKKKRVNIFKLDSIMQMLFDNFRMPSGRVVNAQDVAISDTDSCIYVLSRQAGEGGDRKMEEGDFLLTEQERQSIAFCAAHYDRFLLVINAGSSVDVSFLEEIPGINAVLYICQLGSQGGNAFADVVSGKVSPSGKLSDTWARQYGDIPFGGEYSYLGGNLQDEYYKEGIFVGYRYFDSFQVEPAYPFGFGLGYSRFDLWCAGVMAEGTSVTVRCDVDNMGSYSGKEVAQLYVSAPRGKLGKEYQSLAAFAKTGLLQSQDRQTLELTFDLRDMASYRESDNCYVLEKGEYLLRLGNSSRNTRVVGVVELPGEIIVSRHEAICPLREAMEELKAPVYEKETVYEGLPRMVVTADMVDTVVYTYETPGQVEDEKVKAFVDTLSDEEMTHILVGSGMFGGENRFNLPGSVGNTTSKFWDRGLANVTLCDGPAGIRIQKVSTVDKKGKVKPVEMALSIFEAFPDGVKKFMVGNPEKETPLYQYTTAFPVAAALAQTWNKELLYRVGEGIYREMQEYGCTYWLAPAINIHRNPLCGRNFEYFSEDPRLTGELAAAIIRGVQQEEGFYVTVKHYACNNQEDNRNAVSSNLSQRALREIYLKGFELAVRKGGAKAIMTSYNRVNGVYAPNSYDLCTRVLRNEWGFDGVVMTDWFSTNRGLADNGTAIAAGNDLIMPGGKNFRREILKGLKEGRVSREQLKLSCSRVVKSIFNSQIQREFLG